MVDLVVGYSIPVILLICRVVLVAEVLEVGVVQVLEVVILAAAAVITTLIVDLLVAAVRIIMDQINLTQEHFGKIMVNVQ